MGESADVAFLFNCEAKENRGVTLDIVNLIGQGIDLSFRFLRLFRGSLI